jgi:hypothetical protein
MADEDLWHVRVASDDVKILPLEKLDDLFRLDVIDGDTLVWQPGMDEWLPLRVVAGIGDDAPEVVNIAVSEPPPRPIAAATATSWPPQALPRQGVTSRPPQVGSLPPPRTAPPPSLSRTAPLPSRPAPPPPSSRAPASYAPAAAVARESAWPSPTAWQPPPSPVSPYAQTASAAQFPLYADVPAQAVDTDVRRPRRSGGAWLVVVALAAGAVVTLYRNAVVHAAAKSMGQEKTYLNLETALGGPSFGTPRAVERMTESSKALVESAASVAASITTQASPVNTVPAVMAPSTPAPIAAAPQAAAPAATQAAPAAPQKVAESAPKTGATRPASVSTPMSRPAPAAKESESVFGAPKKGKKAKGNEFDPLNPNL